MNVDLGIANRVGEAAALETIPCATFYRGGHRHAIPLVQPRCASSNMHREAPLVHEKVRSFPGGIELRNYRHIGNPNINETIRPCPIINPGRPSLGPRSVGSHLRKPERNARRRGRQGKIQFLLALRAPVPSNCSCPLPLSWTAGIGAND